MKKSKRFQSVIKIASAHERQAATALGEAQAALQSQMARLEELLRYQEEYRLQFQRTGSLGVDARRIEDYCVFLDKLRQAIRQQQDMVEAAQQAVDERKQAWFSSRGKLKTYDNVMERFQTEERRQEDKREQKETDERAQRTGSKHSSVE
jgi:flagellar FliJ protein